MASLAELPMDDELPDDESEESQPVTMLDAIKAPNLVPLLANSDVAKIGADACAEYQIDLTSCKEFHDRYDRAMDMAMQRPKAKTFPWVGASNVIFPLLTQAAVQFHARAYPAIVDGGSVVKGKVLGADPEGVKRQRADRIAAHMTWQYLHDVPGWEEDTDKLLLQLPIVGCVFRKTWRDTMRGQNNSETVSAKDFVIHNDTVSLDKAPRFTHVQRYYPHEIEAFVRSGQWEKITYDGDDGNDPHSLVTILEQHRLIDMDDDGLPEPYVVTLTQDGQVARIVACYDADGIYLNGPQGQVALSELMGMGPEVLGGDVRVVRIEPRTYFTKYGFIPAPDGSFYDIGFGSLTDNLAAAVNTIVNQLIDAGTLANMQGGFIAGGTKIRGGNMRFTPGEWKRVEGATAGPLRDNILPLQLPGPSNVLFSMLGMLVESIKGITSVSDILTGQQESQTAPTTALALIEEGQKVFTAIYQRVHRALGQDIKIMFRLNRDYLDQEEYFALNDTADKVSAEDYNDKDMDVCPVSDPRSINDRVKVAKAQVLMMHNGDPLVNQMEIRKRAFEAAGIDNIPPLFDVPQPAPPPEAIKAMADTENETARTKAEIRNKDAMTAKTLIEAATAAYQLGLLVGDARIIAQSQAMLADAVAMADALNGETDEQAMPAGGLQPMEGAPADQGVPEIPGGLPLDAGGGMGGGAGDVPGAAIPGGSDGGLVPAGM